MKSLNTLFQRIPGISMLMCSFGSTMLLGFVMLATMTCGVTDDNETRSDLEQAKLLFEQHMEDPENITVRYPDEDPGIPIYARVGPVLNQFFITEGLLIIPFYRDPECIRDDFNFLTYYDPPTAFGCELAVEGKFVIENDAEDGDFPIMAHTEGSQVPVWIVDWNEFQALIETKSVTLPDIEATNPIKAVAQQYAEYLSPRFHEHEVIIEATGTIPDTEQRFTFTLTHRGDQIESITWNME